MMSIDMMLRHLDYERDKGLIVKAKNFVEQFLVYYFKPD